MIDLHCHILPGIDDGAADLSVALRMAELFVDQGVDVVACTPHILPGVYQNTGHQILAAVAALQQEIDRAGLPLQLVAGADNHVVPDFVQQLAAGHLLTLGGSRYVLVEPPHHVAPVRLEDLFFSILVAGYVPILTHPERLTWIEAKYDLVTQLADRGVWMQVTVGSLRGKFGGRAKYWAERMLAEGRVHILATDAHEAQGRRPDLREGAEVAERLVGAQEALELVALRPRGILENRPPQDLSAPRPQSFEDRAGDSNDDASLPIDHAHGGLFGRLRNIFAR